MDGWMSLGSSLSVCGVLLQLALVEFKRQSQMIDLLKADVWSAGTHTYTPAHRQTDRQTDGSNTAHALSTLSLSLSLSLSVCVCVCVQLW